MVANRLAYALTYGAVDSKLVVRHRCANSVCCNPSHLVLGTQRDNSLDWVVRKRLGVKRGVLLIHEEII
ncbi:HNH endonuclease [Herpetosiphon geysericola]|uniref:HNH endonuclease n=1 Tax=Herpetosiphon geysericola TaxID=70996 RepID=UPI0038B3C6FB